MLKNHLSMLIAMLVSLLLVPVLVPAWAWSADISFRTQTVEGSVILIVKVDVGEGEHAASLVEIEVNGVVITKNPPTSPAKGTFEVTHSLGRSPGAITVRARVFDPDPEIGGFTSWSSPVKVVEGSEPPRTTATQTTTTTVQTTTPTQTTTTTTQTTTPQTTTTPTQTTTTPPTTRTTTATETPSGPGTTTTQPLRDLTLPVAALVLVGIIAAVIVIRRRRRPQ